MSVADALLATGLRLRGAACRCLVRAGSRAAGTWCIGGRVLAY